MGGGGSLSDRSGVFGKKPQTDLGTRNPSFTVDRSHGGGGFVSFFGIRELRPLRGSGGEGVLSRSRDATGGQPPDKSVTLTEGTEESDWDREDVGPRIIHTDSPSRLQ